MTRYKDALLVAVALLCAAFAAYVDLRSDDMLILASFIVGSALVLTMIDPERPRRWGVLVGLGVPAAEIAARLMHTTLPYVTEPPTVIGTLTIFAASFILSFTGALGGYVVRNVILVSTD